MSTRQLREAPQSPGRHGMPVTRSRARLSIEEVRESGLPAYFFDHGEHLLYLDGELYDLEERDAALRAGSQPRPLPHQILEDGVGVEYGWRHAAGCVCPHCWNHVHDEGAHAHVA